MGDRAVKHTTAKGGASAADMAARPFQCEWHEGCAKSFNRKSDLQRHYRIHTNERPYACDYKPCNKTFIQRSALTVHRRTHTGDKPHKCPFLGCGKCFSDSSSLARHRRIHTNDKPYICRNQRCKKAFCRKTTMTKHIRKEHPTESIHEDQDAEYSDVELSDEEGFEDDSDEIKEEPQDLYREPMDAKKMHLSRRPSEYSRNLWPLPGQAAQRPSPLHIERSTIPRPEGPIQEIKLERTSSGTPLRSMTDPYPDDGAEISDYSLSRADTMPNNVTIPSTMPQSHNSGSMTQQYPLRNLESNLGLWSSHHAMQDSPTSLTHSSPSSASTQSHPMFTSQPYQLQAVGIPSHEQMQFPHRHDALVSTTIQQPLSDMTVHEIHLDEPEQQQYNDMAPTPVHQSQYDGGIPQRVSQQDQYITVSREASHHDMYDGPTPQSAMQQYRDEVPATPTAARQIQQYANSLPDAPYQQPQYLGALGSFSTSNQVFPPNNAMFQYNHATTDWWKDNELEEKGWILPNQRVPDFDQWGS